MILTSVTKIIIIFFAEEKYYNIHLKPLDFNLNNE